jgi:hypothetical protein
VTTTGKRSNGATWLRELLLLGGAAGIGLLIGNFLLGAADETEPLVPEPAAARPAVEVSPLTGRPVESVRPDAPTRGIGKTGTPPDGAAVFPDGTWLEPLNGVEKAPPFPGFRNGDFKPVVRIHTNPQTGLQWYIHEGDMVSTTQLVTHESGDKKWTSPEWVVGHPVPTKPVR